MSDSTTNLPLESDEIQKKNPSSSFEELLSQEESKTSVPSVLEKIPTLSELLGKKAELSPTENINSPLLLKNKGQNDDSELTPHTLTLEESEYKNTPATHDSQLSPDEDIVEFSSKNGESTQDRNLADLLKFFQKTKESIKNLSTRFLKSSYLERRNTKKEVLQPLSLLDSDAERNAVIDSILSQSKQEKPSENNSPNQPQLRMGGMMRFQKKHSAQQSSISQKEKEKFENRFQMSKIFVGVAFLTPVTSLLMSSLFLSTEGFTANIVPHRNLAFIDQVSRTSVELLEEEILLKKKKIQEFQNSIKDIEQNKVLSSIMDERINWNNVFQIIESVADKTFEGNKVAKYVTFNNYSGREDRVSIQGQIRNPAGMSWTDLIKFKNALNAEPNFGGDVQITQFTKQKSDAGSMNSGEYFSPFSFQFQYQKNPKVDSESEKKPTL